MSERKNEAVWIESRQRWQINVQSEGIRRTFTSSTNGKKGKVEAEKKAKGGILMKKFFSVIIAVFVIISVFVVPVYADDEIFKKSTL